MKFNSLGTGVLALVMVSAWPALGKIDQESGNGRLCGALLNSRELDDQDQFGHARDLAEITRGRRAAVLLVRWPQDARLGESFALGARVDYPVRPTRAPRGGYFAAAAGSRRDLLNEARRLDTIFGRDRVRFRVLLSSPVELALPRQMVQFGGPDQLRLAQVILDGRVHPDLAFYDVLSAEPYYAFANLTLDAFELAELEAKGLSVGEARDLAAWHRHPRRTDRPNHVIRVKQHDLVSHQALQALKGLAAEPPRPDPTPSTAELAAALDECLGAACPVERARRARPIPAPAPAPPVAAVVSPPPPSPPVARGVSRASKPAPLPNVKPPKLAPTRLELPPLAELRARSATVRADADQVTSFLLRLLYAPMINPRDFLDQDFSITEMFELVWAHYWPGETPPRPPRMRDGKKILIARSGRGHPVARVLAAWMDLRRRIARDQRAAGASRPRQYSSP